MLALYAPDAVHESPLVPHLLGGSSGVLKGRDEIRKLLNKAAPRKPGTRTFFRRGYFTDGVRLDSCRWRDAKHRAACLALRVTRPGSGGEAPWDAGLAPMPGPCGVTEVPTVTSFIHRFSVRT
jgi:hypothetical protein